MSNSRWRTSSLVALIGIIVFMLATAFLRSAANITAQNQFGSEGRPISPAGTLVMDLTTRQPAVGRGADRSHWPPGAKSVRGAGAHAGSRDIRL